MDTIDWNRHLLEQLTWHWENHLRPRFEGLTDEEYFWEPAAGAWTVRPRGTGSASAEGAIQGGSGEFVVDFAFPEPDPAPVTTIAWRLAHVIVGVFGVRNAAHFAGPAMDYLSYDYPGTAAAAVEALDQGYATWVDGVRSLGEQGLLRPCGPAEGPFAEAPVADLVLHIHREVIHHGAEIALLRDLYAAR